MSVSIDQCRFNENYASLGGAIYFQNIQTVLTNTQFSFNYVSKSGGGININCGSNYPHECSTEISNSKFSNNRASLQGGGINYNLAPPLMIEVDFSAN